MRAYNEEIEHLNEVARNRPRAQLVLGKERCTDALPMKPFIAKQWVQQDYLNTTFRNAAR